ncbi:type IV pilus twitching motility protein PilT [Burkholderia territorii]|uniref:type IV pilus twitching motility protein PilT n=1 Tax=Burkholderia territorii TaxID=1503055 RepID=UPI0007B9F7BB|nr:PilT/PilU family type 4a pilus ATPase [Burkholderia territorii]
MEMWDLLLEAKLAGASDLHASAGMPPAIRLDGDIMISDRVAVEPDALARFLHEVMTPAQRRAFAIGKDCDLSMTAPGDGVRYRVHAFWQERGPAAVFHTILPIRSLDELNCPPVLKKIVSRRSGLVLVAGPTGSGKSTTLAGIIDFLNETFPYHIITIEDPIEFIHTSRRSLINQRELHQHTNSFTHALQSVLREDPDCILVSELRDADSIRIAMIAAERGHLVLAALDTQSVTHSVNRVIDVFPEEQKAMVRTRLAESLSGVVCQRLVRRIGGGRIGAWEVMVGTPEIRYLIREGKTAQIPSTLQTSQAQGMLTMEASLQGLVQQQLIVEAERVGIVGQGRV